MNIILILFFTARVSSLEGRQVTVLVERRVLASFDSEDYGEVDYDYEDYQSGDYQDYYDDSGEEEYDDYAGSGDESSGDFYEYETKYYFIPYCHKREEQQQAWNKDIQFIYI